ncbi:unnamed protein product [Periconia digitata]|uniref:RNA helicase n=1 Tax=Periconia digitata TaxID=1303443 RepID=A0A9W4XKH4_9PLEO|nr:unnamed protein product [Periconia digitata]
MSKRPGPEDIDSIRLRSREEYLEKRSELKLAELRRQVQEEQEEERSNPHLSQRELREFARNRETLRLAESRLAIDDGLDGYVLPDADGSKLETLNKRKKKDVSTYKSEVQLWEDEVTARAKVAQIHRPDRLQQDDYEFVFDPTQALNFVSAGEWVDPDKQRLQEQLDAAEKKAKSIQEVRTSLPIYQYKEQFLDALADHQVLIVCAETGSGKTTQLPQYLLDYFNKEGGTSLRIACTQPRRVAAMSVAQRVSEEMGCRLGQEVGYSIRFEDKTSPNTKIQFLTDGLLLRQFLNDPTLSGYNAIIIDEAHERTLATDILMGMIKDVGKYRTDLKIIISSATLDAQKFSQFYNDSPILMIPGRSYPITIYYSQNPEASYLSAAITTVLQIHCSMKDPGDILVFLTGQDEIEAGKQSIEETVRKLGSKIPELVVCPIYSALPQEEQGKIFLPAPPGGRKVILATNIAETSLTVDGVRFVIDSGYSKENVYNPSTGLEQLVVTPISRASSSQRAGRAGRTGPGSCFRLWTRWSHFNELEESTTPEIQRANLSSTLLLLKSIGINDLLNFDFMDPPSATAIAKALEELYSLGALDSTGSLTRVGRQMSELPIDPKLSKTIILADTHQCLEEILTIVAMLGESSALFFAPKDKRLHAEAAKRRFYTRGGGDHVAYLKIFNSWSEAEYDPLWAKENYLQQKALTRARDVREQLQKLCERIGITPSSCGDSNYIPIVKALVAGYFSNAARLNRDGKSHTVLRNGLSVRIHPSSMCHEPTEVPKWCIFSELRLTSQEFIANIVDIDPQWLIDAAPYAFKKADLEKFGIDKKMPKTRPAQAK